MAFLFIISGILAYLGIFILSLIDSNEWNSLLKSYYMQTNIIYSSPDSALLQILLFMFSFALLILFRKSGLENFTLPFKKDLDEGIDL